MLKAIAKKLVIFTELLIFVLVMGTALVITTPAKSAEGSRGFVSWYCTTAKQVEAFVTAPTDKQRNAVLAKGGCFGSMIMGTIGKLQSVVMNGKSPHDMIKIFSIQLDNGQTVFVSMKAKGRSA